VSKITEALSQAELYEQTTGNKVEVVVVSDALFYKILRMGIVETYNFGPTWAFIFPVDI